MLFAARSATALHRLLDVLPVFADDGHVDRFFTLVPGSDFGTDALTAIERVGARTIPWDEACGRSYALILAASPKGELKQLTGPLVLLPHGAGFGKTLPEEGSGDSASGLDPAYLVSDGRALASLHALTHPSELARLAALSPLAAEPATVVGDPTLERILTSSDCREKYRAALGTGARQLIAVTSTWGRESLFRRRPELIANLMAQLPYDAYQLALILHPNERTLISEFDLAQRLDLELGAGMILAGAYEEWAAVLIAADAVVTDHGSTALYAAAMNRTIVGAYDGGGELIPGSPMDALLAAGPHLTEPGSLEAALAAYRPGTSGAVADSAFSERGHALERLRVELYGLLGLAPPDRPVTVRPLPDPSPPAHTPTAFAVRARVRADEVRIDRFPAAIGHLAAHHLTAEYGAGTRYVQSAGLVYRRRTGQQAVGTHRVAWTAGAWTARILDEYPGCGMAAAVVSDDLCVARTRSGQALAVRVEACRDGGRVVDADPAAALSAVYAWLADRPAVPADFTCVIADRPFRVRLSPATEVEAARTV